MPRPLRLAPLAFALLVLSLTAMPAPAQPPPPPTYLIQISLLAASKTGPNELEDMPANTRQAVEDVRQFLPFKSYRLLDTALVRADRGARTTLTGPDDREFRAAFSFNNEPVVAQRMEKKEKLLVRQFELVEKIAVAPQLLTDTGDSKPPAAVSSKQVLSSSFAAEIGQTVVVGTSRLNGGDEALIVLFTALP